MHDVPETIKVPLTVFFRDQVFLLDTPKTISSFFSNFAILTQRSQNWEMNTEILEFNEEGENLECYFVQVQLSGEGDFRNANMSARFYVQRRDITPSVELIEFL